MSDFLPSDIAPVHLELSELDMAEEAWAMAILLHCQCSGNHWAVRITDAQVKQMMAMPSDGLPAAYRGLFKIRRTRCARRSRTWWRKAIWPASRRSRTPT